MAEPVRRRGRLTDEDTVRDVIHLVRRAGAWPRWTLGGPAAVPA